VSCEKCSAHYRRGYPVLLGMLLEPVTEDNMGITHSQFFGGELSGIALGYGMDDLGFESRGGLGSFFLHHRVHTGSGAHPASYPIGTRAISLRVKRRGVKLTTHLHLVLRSRMRGAIPPLPQYAFMEWCSVKAQGQLYLYLLPSCVLTLKLNTLLHNKLHKSQSKSLLCSQTIEYGLLKILVIWALM
jgi:hypothetical protein